MLIFQRVRQRQMLLSYYGPDTSLLLHPHSSIATCISVVSWYFSLTHIFTTSPIFSVNVHCGQYLPTYLLLYFFLLVFHHPSSMWYLKIQITVYQWTGPLKATHHVVGCWVTGLAAGLCGPVCQPTTF